MRSIIKLNPDEQSPKCSLCVYSKPFAGLTELSCEKKGVVAPDYKCKKFSLDIMAKTSRRKHSLELKGLSAEDFSID